MDDHLTYFRAGPSAFLLQNFYDATHVASFMMHLLVRDMDAWWRHVRDSDIAGRYGVMAQAPQDHPRGMRDFVLVDPTGVLWRIGQGVPPG